MASFDKISPRPADPLLGLMAAFREDTRPTKLDLGVGVYRTDDGVTPIMKAVRQAETRLAETATTKVYEGPRGNTDFVAAIDKMVFDDEGSDCRDGFSTPGGCGALSLGMALVRRATPDATVWVSDPTWPNHIAVARAAGLDVASYPYGEPGDTGIDIDRLIAGLKDAKPGDVVLIQGPCHNPTGIDLDEGGWRALGEYCAANDLLPLVDTAYHGFAKSLDEDIAGVREFLDLVPEALVSYSCSKNFGLYRERTGCLLIKAQTPDAAKAAGTHLAEIARASYSMPPAHGQAIVATILGDEALRATWMEELNAMRDRMNSLRASLAEALHPQSNSYDPQVLTAQNGMFSQLPLSKENIDSLREEHGVYIPGSGRINIAGLSADQVGPFAERVSGFL